MPVTPFPLARVQTRAPVLTPFEIQRRRRRARPLAQILLDSGAVEPGDLLKAVAIREREDVSLGDILLAHGWITDTALTAALSEHWAAPAVDLAQDRPDPRLADRLGPDICLAEAVLPWRRVGNLTLVATARPERFQEILPMLRARFGPCAMALAPERAIHAALLSIRQTQLARRAEQMVPATLSCRGSDPARNARGALAVLGALILALALAPRATLAALLGWALLTLVLVQGLKFVALVAAARRPPRATGAAFLQLARPGSAPVLPRVSVLVPLYREQDIAPRLVRRLGRLDYPKELLDVLLIVEEEDAMTRAALDGAELPFWMRVIVVPRGPIRTKPRALNFAMNFARGKVIGVYDAEDAPEPDQIHQVVRRFAEAPPEVVCLQGILDFYNPRSNWLARCFTVEYAAWFRAWLPGLARLGLVVPLGGTTLFLRREALMALGGWDAHNVTEDADLGLRIARCGWRTEMIASVTGEEANCRALPWIKQRSRWQKGFAMTWAVHMREPRRLWRELGARQFCGVQILLLGTLSQAICAPILWTFWLLALGLPGPLLGTLPGWLPLAAIGLMLAAEAVNWICGGWACRGPDHRHLWKWVPTLYFYNLLGTVSAWKALHQVVTRPFYWEKTAHGQDTAEALSDAPLAEGPLLLTGPVAMPCPAERGPGR